MSDTFLKDPTSTLDYVFDWSDWLAEGESIQSFQITVPTGITLGTGTRAPVEDEGKITYWLSGGTKSFSYTIQCTVTSDAVVSRIDNRKMIIKVIDR